MTLVLAFLAFNPSNHRARDTIFSLRIKLLNFDLEKNTNLRVEREGEDLRRGKERACGADGWMDRWTEKRARGERREGGLGLGSRQNQKREGNERVAWTAVVAVCFIDRTW